MTTHDDVEYGVLQVRYEDLEEAYTDLQLKYIDEKKAHIETSKKYVASIEARIDLYEKCAGLLKAHKLLLEAAGIVGDTDNESLPHNPWFFGGE